MKLKQIESNIKDNLDYQTKQKHSDVVDDYYGFSVYDIESSLVDNAQVKFPNGNYKSWGKSLYAGSEAWIGLHPRQLQTTYYELIECCRELDLKEGETLCDLGAGFGRAGIVIGELYPKSFFIGLEIVSQRVEDGNKIYKKKGFSNCKLIEENLDDPSCIPICDYYFIYDFGIVGQIKKVLEKLSDISSNKKIKIIARGRGVKTLIQNSHPWLTVFEIKHFETFSIFSSHSS